MPRTRKSRRDLPPRVYVKHNAYYFVTKDSKWIRLAAVGQEQEMRMAWAKLEQPIEAYGTVAALIDDYLVSYAAKEKAPRTYQDNLKESVYLKAYFGDMQPKDVLPRHVGAYLDANLDTRRVRANREKALFSHVFTWAMRHESWGQTITQNPCKGVKGNKESKRVRIVSDQAFNELFKVSNENVQRLMTLIYRTLQRPSDILLLGSANVVETTLDGKPIKILDFNQGKTKFDVKIILTDELLDILYYGRPRNQAYEYFITSASGAPYQLSSINSNYSRAFQKFSANHEATTGKKPIKFGFYDLKGKGATDMYQSGIALEKIQMLTGHKSVKTTEIYIKQRILTPIESNTRVIKTAEFE